jgi:serine/threonine protein kinase
LKGGDLSVATKVPDLGKWPNVFRTMKEGTSIQDFYDFGEEIFSSGCISRVLTAKRKSDGSEVVVKMRPKGRDRVSERGWRQIMVNLGRLNGHSHVLDISEILEDSNTYYVVMPRCDGGELFELLATAEEIPERECKRIIREILAAVAHLHKNDLIHRDIKPENILFHTHGDSTSPKTVKLIDFDTVAGWTPQSPKTKTFVGTPGYIAPEVLLGEASPQSDLWSIGVIFYILMTGDSPWSSIATLEDGTVGSPKARKVYDQMRDEVLDWEEDPWPAFPLARDLCQKLIAFNTKSRLMSAQDALEHPWLKES